MILWKGHCSVHTRFTAKQIESVRRAASRHPRHRAPEVPWDVVQAADDSGSTEYIIKTVTNSPAGSSGRSAPRSTSSIAWPSSWRPERTVLSLDQFGCLCSTMFRVSPNHLLWILEELVEGRVHNRIVVPDEQKHWNRVALDRMLSISVGADHSRGRSTTLRSRSSQDCTDLFRSEEDEWRTNCPSSRTTSPRSNRTSTRRRCRFITGSIIRLTSPT